MLTTIAQLFDPRGGQSVIRDRCERCDEPTIPGSALCDECGELDMGEDEAHEDS